MGIDAALHGAGVRFVVVRPSSCRGTPGRLTVDLDRVVDLAPEEAAARRAGTSWR